MSMKGLLKGIVSMSIWIFVSSISTLPVNASQMDIYYDDDNVEDVILSQQEAQADRVYLEHFGMYEDELVEIYKDYLEKIGEPIATSKGYSKEVLDGFSQYAVEQGIISDTAEQKAGITKAVVRAEFRILVNGGRLLGYATASDLLDHSLQDNPTNLNYNTLSDKSQQISNSSEYQEIITQFISGANANNLTSMTMSGSIALDSTVDLHLAYNNVNYTMTAVKSNGKWIGSIVFTDTYDFDAVSWKAQLSIDTLIDIINNYAAYAESIGAIVPYNITVTVPVSY